MWGGSHRVATYENRVPSRLQHMVHNEAPKHVTMRCLTYECCVHAACESRTAVSQPTQCRAHTPLFAMSCCWCCCYDSPPRGLVSPLTTAPTTPHHRDHRHATTTTQGREGKRGSRGLPTGYGGLQLLQPGRVHGDPRFAVRVLISPYNSQILVMLSVP